MFTVSTSDGSVDCSCTGTANSYNSTAGSYTNNSNQAVTTAGMNLSYTPSNGSNWIAYNGSPSTSITVSNTLDDIDDRLKFLEGYYSTAVFDYLNEDEISEIVDKIKERDYDYYKTLITSLVSNRHFSENFLLNYITELDKDILFRRHKSDILSQKYLTIATRLALQGK